MQQKDEKTIILAKTLGKVIKDLRLNHSKCSINQFAHEYDLDVGNTSRVEKGVIDVKFVTLWKIAEGLKIETSELVRKVEASLDKDFHFYEE